MNLLITFIDAQIGLSRLFDRLLPLKFSIDGNRHFLTEFAPGYLKSDMKVYDVGGGKNPYITLKQKRELSLVVVGLDIDKGELEQAPDDIYDEIIRADIMEYKGKRDADLVICQSLLEHVRDVDRAFASIASMLKPTGRALIFVPSKNAVYARLNKIMPEAIKKKILFSLYPQTRRNQGFKSYYNRCSPRDFRKLARRNGLQVEESEFYYVSSYFSCFFPIYLIWRIWVLIFYIIAGTQAAETFSMALRKRPD
jgi:2-polyprenyl-6-hydroxyphenyl methylase/3-demethylubiquinone-9 3-methyltransferase